MTLILQKIIEYMESSQVSPVVYYNSNNKLTTHVFKLASWQNNLNISPLKTLQSLLRYDALKGKNNIIDCVLILIMQYLYHLLLSLPKVSKFLGSIGELAVICWRHMHGVLCGFFEVNNAKSVVTWGATPDPDEESYSKSLASS